MSSSVLALVRENRKTLKAQLDATISPTDAAGELRSMTPAEESDWNKKLAELRAFDERIEELEQQEYREGNLARHNMELGIGGAGMGSSRGEGVDVRASGWSISQEPHVYRDPLKDPTSPSFFRDMRDARLGNFEASERLTRNNKAAVERETRAGDLTTVAGAGGEWAPPLWIVSEFVALARPGRVAANLATHDVLPNGVSSINLPKVASGATTAVQQTQNSALSDTAMTTTSVSSGITTVGGKQIVSLQLLNQSGMPFDRVILQDLAADYAKQVDNQFLYGTAANGQVRGIVAVGTATTFTSASPAFVTATAANSFYNKVIAAIANVATTRYLPADAILMHPVRWGWCLQALDGNVRPVISADGQSVNTAAISTDVVAEGSVGTLAKLPVFVDPNVSQTANSATNQDEVYVLRREDLLLYESPLRLESFDQPFADQAAVLFRALGWIAAIPNRYSSSIVPIRGTGMVVPVL